MSDLRAASACNLALSYRGCGSPKSRPMLSVVRAPPELPREAVARWRRRPPILRVRPPPLQHERAHCLQPRGAVHDPVPAAAAKRSSRGGPKRGRRRNARSSNPFRAGRLVVRGSACRPAFERTSVGKGLSPLLRISLRGAPPARAFGYLTDRSPKRRSELFPNESCLEALPPGSRRALEEGLHNGTVE